MDVTFLMCCGKVSWWVEVGHRRCHWMNGSEYNWDEMEMNYNWLEILDRRLVGQEQWKYNGNWDRRRQDGVKSQFPRWKEDCCATIDGFCHSAE